MSLSYRDLVARVQIDALTPNVAENPYRPGDSRLDAAYRHYLRTEADADLTHFLMELRASVGTLTVIQ